MTTPLSYTTAEDILVKARNEFKKCNGSFLNIIDIAKPATIEEAKILVKIVSKLSPLLGNMIEFSTVRILNGIDWGGLGFWMRQDPGFPDALFSSSYFDARPGIEIKAWFPLATEISARFKDSEEAFRKENIDMALVVWLPENIIWGKPKIIDTLFVRGSSVAKYRDEHYHRPPDYIILEPEDTSDRTSNLQQTNTTGYKLQKNEEAAAIEVQSWVEQDLKYSTNPSYQAKLRKLMSIGVYRSDSNYSKIDRIKHPEIESFKQSILKKKIHDRTIQEWGKILSSSDDKILENALIPLMNIK